MQIVDSLPKNQISLDNAMHKNGIIVAVHNRSAKVLSAYSDHDEIVDGYAFQSLAGGGWHSASQSKREALVKNLDSRETKLYLFPTLAEFAQAALDNKWEI
jgi:hypothetical protein